MKDTKGIAITNAFPKISDKSNHKPNKIWVDKGNEFCDRLMKSWLEKNALEMYSTDNQWKSVIVVRIIRTLKNKIYKDKTSVLKNVYIDKFDDIVNKYNNTYHSTNKMKPVDVKSNTCIKSGKEIINLM